MKKTVSARSAALETIRRVEGGVGLQEALDSTLSAVCFDIRDRRLCSDLVYGYFRRKPRLDFIIDRFLKRPEKTSRVMRSILGMGLYGILFQDSVPNYAAIDEAVGMAKRKLGDGPAKTVNAVLRNACRSLAELRDPEWYEKYSPDVWSGKAIWHSVPPPLARLWKTAYGEENASSLMERSSRRPWTGARINSFANGAEELKKELDAIIADGSGEALGENGYVFAPGKTPSILLERGEGSPFAQGLFSFQSEGSRAILRELGLYAWREPVWDCCAGVGGKSLALLNEGVPVALASDPFLPRLREFRADLKRLKLPPLGAVRASALFPPLAYWPGNILADVPCSGSGVLARRPDLRLKAPDIPALTSLQLSILESLAPLLEPDRELAYITCSLDPRENEEVIERFLKARKDM
ncbi:MAG: antitermination protein NusB, partial [Desulfovibrio sp.]|nr:antitermination protein NusB [Desulfovibrio sp.]